MYISFYISKRLFTVQIIAVKIVMVSCFLTIQCDTLFNMQSFFSECCSFSN